MFKARVQLSYVADLPRVSGDRDVIPGYGGAGCSARKNNGKIYYVGSLLGGAQPVIPPNLYVHNSLGRAPGSCPLPCTCRSSLNLKLDIKLTYSSCRVKLKYLQHCSNIYRFLINLLNLNLLGTPGFMFIRYGRMTG